MNAEEIKQLCLDYIDAAAAPGNEMGAALADVRNGGDFEAAYNAAEIMAEETANALAEYIDEEAITAADTLGKIGTAIVAPLLRTGHAKLIDAAAGREALKLKELKIGLTPIRTDADEARIYDIALKYDKVRDHKEFIALVGGMTVAQFYGAALDTFNQENATFQFEAGLEVTLYRKTGGESCKFCDRLCGFTPIAYDGTADCGTGYNLFARHKGCQCAIDVRTERGGSLNRVNNYMARR